LSYGSGSSGYTSVARIKAAIDEFFARPAESQTSAVFASIWSSRAVAHLDVPLPYEIGGGEANASSGWYQYLRRLHNSTLNTSTRSISGNLGLPSPVWTQFVADEATLTALSTLIYPDGTTDADHGRRVYQFLASTVINSNKYRRGQYRELLEAWGAVGADSVGSS